MRGQTGVAGSVLAALLLAVTSAIAPGALAEDPDVMTIGYIGMEPPGDRAPVSLLDPELDDEGVQGARLGIADNNATGQFLGQDFTLVEAIVPDDGDVHAGLDELVDAGAQWIVSGLPYEALRSLMEHPDAQARVVFNAGAPDDSLRGEHCRANLFHTMPSRRMQADALAQFLRYKRWNRWALVHGNTDEDRRLVAAYRDAAQRFGMRVVGEKEWPHTAMARRAEGGFHAIQREIPVFVQDFSEHDVLVIADETDYFGEYFPHQTRLPRPVAGTQGLMPTAWHRGHESWGAVQLHRRFEDQAERWMTPRDFAAWVAVRALGEAASRTGSVEREVVEAYMLGDDFALAAYLGQPVSFRSWDRQLRQPMLLAGPRMIVSVSPQEGFEHPNTPLDSLGHDAPESRCELD
ncbi:ABC transporter substrate-binding protein [Aquisalimonas asiatica]|uniref:ABC transporter, substrate binding protein, PQQ-dependent alcohol dehydrogenase system n=1 Tax=Aquisalimonas asiatica TaxID=406100 RepID=A0A1H8UFT0_9GAMM|nr:ABC transporter substrate-binding protein [Aquisalimonas asiatica]SEP02031.1 ABC transporter, substrate binding protein, PQQ-dependent alcohol dehydrogenase system [Aquisalimonas asiatica]